MSIFCTHFFPFPWPFRKKNVQMNQCAGTQRHTHFCLFVYLYHLSFLLILGSLLSFPNSKDKHTSQKKLLYTVTGQCILRLLIARLGNGTAWADYSLFQRYSYCIHHCTLLVTTQAKHHLQEVPVSANKYTSDFLTVFTAVRWQSTYSHPCERTCCPAAVSNLLDQPKPN